MNRKEEYQDERWKARAEEIRELDHHRCAMCGAEGVELHVHHLAYPPPPFHLWDAEDKELVTLCKDCHDIVHVAIFRPVFDSQRKLHYRSIGLDIGVGKDDWGDVVELYRCGECTFHEFCCTDKQTIACNDFEQRLCEYCQNYMECENTDGEIESYCRLGIAANWHDECVSCRGACFSSKAKNHEELIELLKSFDK